MRFKGGGTRFNPIHGFVEPTLTHAALTQAEIDDVKAFLEGNDHDWPDGIHAILGRLIALYVMLANAKKKSGDILRTLRMAMGIIPTSERGKQLLTKR